MAAETQTSNDILQLVSFKIGKEEFGIDILKVQEINRMLNLTKVPNAPYYIDGVVNLRGRIIPIVNLRAKLGMERREADRNSRIVVVELSGKTIGFLVDEVSEVLRIPESITEQPPAMVAGVDSSFIRAIGKLEDRLLILLDLEKVLSAEETNYLNSLSN
ncbi:chemotaxis protein CheW [Melioribacter sp. Ez-97]|jgi:purine-binding chemotaxis protein CheW|uniref:chemotaxis protein CheW n=1 Tax=Melioribacter sp. Ez-97 TaxID=3423434 RepID=UPI003ED8E4F4